MLIEKIDCPKDLKKLSLDECVVLADEIRQAILKTVSITGGHLSSNLGVVELTIALHYVFNSPKDRLIFDTSHQCYVHKILTGRKDAFIDSSCYKKYSGYTNPDESDHDLFKFGHTSTSISLACGLAISRDLKCEKENVIAVIGDGALGGGEALAGLNFAGSEVKGNLIVILNDNQMSIAENHGGLYEHLAKLRKNEGNCRNNIFRSLGFEYIFEKEGNDIRRLVEILNRVKDTNHPTLLHICTVKGKGYTSAEKYKEDSHWVKPFQLDTGILPVRVSGERYDRIVRDFLLTKMKEDPRIVAIVAAVPNALAFDEETRKMMGKQYIDVGIMEEHAISMAAGIAKNGGKPIFSTRSTFIQRTYDQISQELGINSLPATIILVNASVYAPTDTTHMGLFDIPLLSNIPNVVFLAPTNKQEYLSMLNWSIEQDKYPVVIRAPRNGVYQANRVMDDDYSALNKFEVVQKGSDIAIIAVGDFFQMGEETADFVKEVLEINVTLINPRFVSGIDDQLLGDLKNDHSVVITLEDGMLDGGFGQKVSAYYGNSEMKVLNYGFRKEFFDYYDTEEMLNNNRIKPNMILEDIMQLLKEQ